MPVTTVRTFPSRPIFVGTEISAPRRRRVDVRCLQLYPTCSALIFKFIVVRWKADANSKLSGAVYLDGSSEFNRVMRKEMEEVSRHER